jgi:dATP pyrophosphohydrolase
VEYAIFFRRSPRYGGLWQWVAGGGEDAESPIEAARREANEEAGIPLDANYLLLESMATIPAPQAAGMLWGPDVLVVPEYAFGVDVQAVEIRISHEHEEFRWVSFAEAQQMLRFDSNKNALWELDHRLTNEAKSI